MQSTKQVYKKERLVKGKQVKQQDTDFLSKINQILKIKQELTAKNAKKLIDYLEYILNGVKKDGFSFLIALHHFEVLYLILVLSSEDMNIDKKAVNQLATLYLLFEQVFFTKIDKYRQIFKKASSLETYKEQLQIKRAELIKNNQQQNKQSDIKPKYTLQSQQHIFKMVKEYFELSAITDREQRRLQVNIFITGCLIVNHPETKFQEIVFTWLKKSTEALQMIEQMNKSEICCKLLYIHEEAFEGKEGRHQQFKNYFWPIQKDILLINLRKTIVAFLNLEGGIIYFGLKENSLKRMEAAGMALTLREKLDLLIFVYEQTCHIYPEEGSNKERSQWVAEQRKAQQNCPPPMDTEEEYYVNDYCSVDFIHVVDEQTQAYVQIKPQTKLYIVRVKIKQGNQRELYHMINEKEMIETYIREEDTVKKKTFVEFYKLFYERAKNKDPYPILRLHPYCRFVYKER